MTHKRKRNKIRIIDCQMLFPDIPSNTALLTMENPAPSTHQVLISAELGNGNQMPNVDQHQRARGFGGAPPPLGSNHSRGECHLEGRQGRVLQGCHSKFSQVWWPHQDITVWSLPPPPFYLCQRRWRPCGNWSEHLRVSGGCRGRA